LFNVTTILLFKEVAKIVNFVKMNFSAALSCAEINLTELNYRDTKAFAACPPIVFGGDEEQLLPFLE
jgi:hypothetical protein